MRLRLDIAYDGTDFSGWAAQPGLRTVQGELEKWLTTTLRLTEPASLTVAGRTDAGVHARGQVAHVDLPDDTSPAQVLRRLAAVLPPDLVVHRATIAPEGFDARFSAVWRRYVYRLVDDLAAYDPLTRHGVATLRGPLHPASHLVGGRRLDVDAMTEAGRELLGLRDFAAFCKRREGATTIRTLLAVTPVRTAHGTVETTVIADAFCHSMVRSLMGALASVGSHQRDLVWLRSLLDAGSRRTEVPVLAAGGLTLEEVGYPDENGLAARAAQARATRTLDVP